MGRIGERGGGFGAVDPIAPYLWRGSVMSCEFCPLGGGGCIVCEPGLRVEGGGVLTTAPVAQWGGRFDPDTGDCPMCNPGEGSCPACTPKAFGVMSDDPMFTASVLSPDSDRLRGRPVPVTVFVSWEWWGVEVSGPLADCLEYLTCRELPPSARPSFAARLRKAVRG